MWVRNREIPDDTICNRDPCLLPDFSGSLTAQLGIKHRHRSAYHPHSDGHAENPNAVIERYLNVHVAQRQQDWVHLLQLAKFT